ncbi:26S proteasome non-ATPase regulatory subunit 9 [Chamberlinius hualienensis]
MTTITREFVKELIKKKDEIEEEIETNQIILQSQGNVGMSESLVDREGYPRNDIDVYKVRQSRHNIICLQNDYKALMKEIENAMHMLHAQEREKSEMAGNRSHDIESKTPAVNEFEWLEKSFAKIDLVSPGSPADEAGLKVGDIICEFGSVNKRNFSSVQDIGSLVQHSVGRSVGLVILRDRKKVNLSMKPRTWIGQGLLGCRIVPISSS